ncbi:MAG TPA: hypothetical protein VIF62_17010 [Labilithrix sp.]
MKIGYDLSKDGKCDEAIPHFVESLRLDPKAITLINLANCEEKVGRLADALGHWAEARAHAQSENAKPIADEAEKRQSAIESRVPHLTITLAKGAPEGTTVSRDGVALGAPSIGVALPVNPGAHVLVAAARGRAEGRAEITIAEGEAKAIEIAPGEPRPEPPAEQPRPAARRGTSPLVWIGFGTAVAGVAVGSITGAIALGKASSAKDACPDHTCADPAMLDDVSAGRTFGTVSTIAFIVAGVGAAVGIYGLLARPSADATSIAIGPGALRGSF